MKTVKITFLNGNELEILPDDILMGYKTFNDNEKPYIKILPEFKLSELSDEERIGFFNACDVFTLENCLDSHILYKTSAIYTFEVVNII